MGNITPLLDKIKPALQIVNPENNIMDDDEIEEVSIQNVKLAIERIRKESKILAEMEKMEKLKF